MIGAPPREHQKPVDTNALVHRVFEFLPGYIGRMGLPVTTPKKSDVKLLTRYDGDWENAVQLTNGWTFHAISNEMTGFIAPKSLFSRDAAADKGRPAKEYIGQWKLTEAAARKIAEEAVRKHDPVRTMKLLASAPRVQRANDVGIYVIPRFAFEWYDDKTLSHARAEIDASNGSVRFLFVFAALPQPRSPTAKP
jgi:hypothetical protein